MRSCLKQYRTRQTQNITIRISIYLFRTSMSHFVSSTEILLRVIFRYFSPLSSFTFLTTQRCVSLPCFELPVSRRHASHTHLYSSDWLFDDDKKPEALKSSSYYDSRRHLCDIQYYFSKQFGYASGGSKTIDYARLCRCRCHSSRRRSWCHCLSPELHLANVLSIDR
jgi:hypothetical protein